MKIIFAQGNPEPKYAGTRHNIGFEVLNDLAEHLDAKWEEKPKFNAYIAKSTIDGEQVLLVKPTTYYNETGTSARKLIDFYKLNSIDDIIVVHDDLALNFGIIRLRQGGRDAGNNGIKSLASHIGPDFARIRIGILTDKHERFDDSDYVTSRFSSEEKKILKEKINPTTIDIIKRFCDGDFEHTSHKL